MARKSFKKAFKIGGGLAFGGATGNPIASFSANKDVLGARGSFRDPGSSIDHAKEKKMGEAFAVEQQQKDASAAAAVAAEEPFNVAKESQRKGLLRKGRRSSILTSSQGADPLGLVG